METKTIDRLIVNSPYEEPKHYWSYDHGTGMFTLKDGRRPAGYIVASEDSQAHDDPGVFRDIPLVNQIRPRVDAWREAGYPGVTGITKRLLEHWRDTEARQYPFFFCQLEAIETLIWLVEASPAEKVGIDIPSDGGAFQRLCSKLATGTGKTIVMAMVIAWQVINKVTTTQDARFSKNVLIVAPGLTVKNRLQVLIPAGEGNYYDVFGVVPTALLDKLRQGTVIITNWHNLAWDTEEQIAKRRSVDKRGAKSDTAYVREVLGVMANNKNILVINDEAHHAWRVGTVGDTTGVSKDEIEESTVWVGGLDRIHRVVGINKCFDFTATPFVPSGKKSTEEALFGWIVSDFGLNDAIESGLVKTPRVVIRDNGQLAPTYKSRFYHLYRDPDVKDDINRKAEPHELLPQLVENAYYFLGLDWLETAKSWKERGFPTPPVMISVANNTFTAARIKNSFDRRRIKIDELCDPERTVHIDSKVLSMAEAQTEPVVIVEATDDSDEDGGVTTPKLTKAQEAELLRQRVDTVGQVGQPGEQIQNLISVGMLSEGWNAMTVTHILGLRAFTSQLLCEQVVGRGLRRTSYDVDPDTGLFSPEHVNIFGVPFSFLPHEGGEIAPPPAVPKVTIEPDAAKSQHEITFPNVIRIDHVFRPKLTLDLASMGVLQLSAFQTPTIADLAPVIEGKPDVTKVSTIDLEELAKKFRLQKIIFETARDVFEYIKPTWTGDKASLLSQVITLTERVMQSDRVSITPASFEQDVLKKRIMLTLNMTKIVQHVFEAIRFENTEALELVFDTNKPILSTGDMRPWRTSKPNEVARKSHINRVVFDSTWEASEAFELDRNTNVESWVKNDHLGFEIVYMFNGVVRKYRPDFLIRLTDGTMLVLEVKGEDSQQDRTKREFLDEWVRGVNADGRWGKWRWAVSVDPADVRSYLN